jgi:hypothetical protein
MDTTGRQFSEELDIARGMSPEQAAANMRKRINDGLDTARFVGETLVPQNLADAASMAALIATAPIAGIAGVAIRVAAALIADMVTGAAAGQLRDLTTALIKGVGSLVGDAVGRVVQYLGFVTQPLSSQAGHERGWVTNPNMRRLHELSTNFGRTSSVSRLRGRFFKTVHNCLYSRVSFFSAKNFPITTGKPVDAPRRRALRGVRLDAARHLGPRHGHDSVRPIVTCIRHRAAHETRLPMTIWCWPAARE